MINLLSHLHFNDDHLYQRAKTLFNYTKNHYPTALILKLFEMIQRNPLSITGIRCYNLLRDLLPSLWLRFPPFTHKDLKNGLNYRLWLEKDYETLKACVSCVSSLAGLLFPKNEWDNLFYFMFRYLGSSSLYRKLGALLLWNDLIPICPEVFMPYIDFLIEGFKDLMPTVTEDHRCGVAAAKASVKLVLYLGNTANYSKFYDLMGYVMMTLFMALGEEVIVCSLLEDLIILAGAKTEFFKVQIDVVIDSMVKVVENLELKERTRQLAIEFVLTVAEDVVSKLLSQLIVMLVHIEDDPNWGNAIGLISEGCSKRGMTMMKEATLATLASFAISSQEDSAYIYDSIMPYLKVILVTATKDTSYMLLTKSLECITMIAMAVGNLAILDYVEKVIYALILLQETHMEVEDPMRSLLLLWNDLIPFCPEVFMPYIDFLIESFKDLMPTVSEDHQCGVAAAKASVKLVLYLGNTANYSKFYDLMGFNGESSREFGVKREDKATCYRVCFNSC
ncbi:uncharacterized protein [Nicotiana tomentosiformis]|uniref:uncharacterized protein n=1 Tax=Nicotiana tomentosiformis TaxID=4098 RepID=UPI00388C6374